MAIPASGGILWSRGKHIFCHNKKSFFGHQRSHQVITCCLFDLIFGACIKWRRWCWVSCGCVVGGANIFLVVISFYHFLVSYDGKKHILDHKYLSNNLSLWLCLFLHQFHILVKCILEYKINNFLGDLVQKCINYPQLITIFHHLICFLENGKDLTTSYTTKGVTITTIHPSSTFSIVRLLAHKVFPWKVIRITLFAVDFFILHSSLILFSFYN